MDECRYCKRSFDTEEEYTAHLANEHDWETLSRIDRKRVKTKQPGQAPDLGRFESMKYNAATLSRRRFVQVGGATVFGTGVGIGAMSLFSDEDAPETVLNIKDDFGAVGNGETEDTEAFQEAMEAAVGGGIIYVPPGNYPIRRVETYANTIIFGEGEESKLLHAPEDLDTNPETYIFDSDEADNIEYRNLFFSGNLSEHEFTGRPGNANSELLDPVGGSNVRIIGCYFEEILAGEAIDLDSTETSQNYSIINNDINMTSHNRAGEGILSRGHNHIIRGNYVVGSDSSPDSERAGSRAAIAVDEGSTRNVIIDNIVEDSARAYDIRQGPDGPTHIFDGNEMRGSFEDLSNFEGVIETDKPD